MLKFNQSIINFIFMKKILLVKIFFLIQILLLSSFEIVNAATKAEKIKEIQDSVDIAQKELENCRGKSCEASAAAKYDEAFNNYDDAWSWRTTVDQAYDNLWSSSWDSWNWSSSDFSSEKVIWDDINALYKDSEGNSNLLETNLSNLTDDDMDLLDKWWTITYIDDEWNSHTISRDFWDESSADTELWTTWTNESATTSSEKYTWAEFNDWKSNTTDSASSAYYNNNLKENSLTKDSFSSLEKAGYVNADWSLTEAWKLASWQTDWKCWTECAKNLNSKASASKKAPWAGWPWDLASTNFVINVDSISPWINAKWSDTKQRVNWLLWTIIQNMMIWLWILSILIMTIWSWYIIFHNWQDELLSKGKSIFMSWVYAMIIALTSYYLISIVRFMLYTWSGSN